MLFKRFFSERTSKPGSLLKSPTLSLKRSAGSLTKPTSKSFSTIFSPKPKISKPALLAK
jgi:hypothetical protein